MDNKKTTFTGYHGTDYEGAQCILKFKNFKYSSKDNEWLGTGIYFFIDKDKNKAIANAHKWTKNYKHFKFYNILKSVITIDSDKILDFDNEVLRDLYHEYRHKKVEDTKKRGIAIETNKIKFDCQVINDICDALGFLASKQQRYISVLEDKGVPNSGIPNCTILCARDNKLIDKNSIKIQKGGLNYG